MINLDGATVLFPTSFGYFDPHILKVAEKYPERHLPALRRPVHGGQAPEERRQLLRLHRRGAVRRRHRRRPDQQEQQARLHRRQADPAGAAQHQLVHAGRALGRTRRSTTTVIFTGDWSMPVKEAEAANSLIDQGVDVLTMHVDSPKVIVETAERRGIFVTGYHANQATLAPKGYLTGAEWNWAKVYTDYVDVGAGGQDLPAPAARRAQGRLREDVAVRQGRLARRPRRRPTRPRRSSWPARWSSTRGRSRTTPARS